MDLAPFDDEDSSTLRARPRVHHVRRRSSHLKRWIEDQQSHSSATPSLVLDLTEDSNVCPVGTRCNPYLAYPHLKFSPVDDDADSLHSYDVVDDDDIPEEPSYREVRVIYT